MQLARPARHAIAADDATEGETIPPGYGEAALIARAQENIADFAPLYERYAPDIHVYCLRRLRHAEEAADATTLVFTRAMGALHRFRPDPRRPGSTFRAWLFTIARNIVLDQHRRSRPSSSLDEPGRELEIADARQNPEQEAIQADDARTVANLLAHLPDRQRSVVELRLAGLSTAEIAATLSITGSATKSLQVRAYRTLRDLVPNHPNPIVPEHDR